MGVLPIVICVHLGCGIVCAVVLVIAVAPRVWGSSRELVRLGVLAIACVPLGLISPVAMIAAQTEYVAGVFERFRGGSGNGR